MKTIKLDIKKSCTLDIQDLTSTYNSIVRFSFNRFQEGYRFPEVRNLANQTFKEKNDLNCWIIQCAIKEGFELVKKVGNKHILFGGKAL